MNRRRFVGKVGLGAAATALVACSSNCPEGVVDAKEENLPEIKWKLVTSWPKLFPGLGLAPENLAKVVSAMTAGQFQIKVYGAGELVSAMEVFDSVVQGTAAIGHSAAYYWKGKMPAAPFFTSVPFGLTAQEMNAWLHYGGGKELWKELYEPFGVISMAGGNTGVQMGGWFNKKINSISDIKGLKMRIPGLAGEVFQRLGGTPVALPGGEIFTSMQTGVIDATEWVGPYNDIAFGLHQVAKYYYYPGWHEPGPTLEFLINKEQLESLPAHYQAVLEQAIRAINQDMLDEYTFRNIAALRQLNKEEDVEILSFPPDVIAEMKQASDVVLKEVSDTSEIAKKIYDSYSDFLAGVTEYSRITEFAFMSQR